MKIITNVKSFNFFRATKTISVSCIHECLHREIVHLRIALVPCASMKGRSGTRSNSLAEVVVVAVLYVPKKLRRQPAKVSAVGENDTLAGGTTQG